MDIEFTQEHPSFLFKDSNLYQVKAERLLRAEGFLKNFLLSVVFMSDDDLLVINKQHLDHDFYTDIITFPIEEDDDNLEAEIYISIDRVKDNAMEFETSFSNELLRVYLHGILHLVGYGDKTAEDKKVMRSKEQYYMSL
jgi:probable rRNA maturation factor